MLFTKLREDRDILAHELNNICQQQYNENIDNAATRDDAIERIDPIQSFNAWNLSTICGPQSKIFNMAEEE